jgi:hypothetical protein
MNFASSRENGTVGRESRENGDTTERRLLMRNETQNREQDLLAEMIPFRESG